MRKRSRFWGGRAIWCWESVLKESDDESSHSKGGQTAFRYLVDASRLSRHNQLEECLEMRGMKAGLPMNP